MTEKNPKMCFILGIKQRCGTNMLHSLLGMHPDCKVLQPIWEDYTVHFSHSLENYITHIRKMYKPKWNVDEKIGSPGILLNYFGDSIIKFLKRQHQDDPRQKAPMTLLTKTPSVKGLHNFFNLYPDARLIILVRDGRAIVESGVKTFKWNFEWAAREWASAAETIIDFQKRYPIQQYNYLIVKYEDLVAHQERELRKIFDFLNLDAELYDFEQVQSMEVIGSSELSKREDGTIHWQGSEKTASFNPLNRWHDWKRAQNERFNWIAGKYLPSFGYTPRTYAKNLVPYRVLNMFLDLKWKVMNRAILKKWCNFINKFNFSRLLKK